MPDHSDAQIIHRAAEGDADAFAVLVDRYAVPLYGVCFGILGNQADAQDCVQETFLKAFCTLSSFRQNSAIYTWLYRIAANCCYDLLRRNRRHPVRSLDEPVETSDGEMYLQLADDAPLPDEALASRETTETVRAAIADLPEPLRRIIVLRDIEDCSYEDIARLEGLRPGTVKSRLFRARLQLAEQLKQRECAVSGRTGEARLPDAADGNKPLRAASKKQ